MLTVTFTEDQRELVLFALGFALENDPGEAKLELEHLVEILRGVPDNEEIETFFVPYPANVAEDGPSLPSGDA